MMMNDASKLSTPRLDQNCARFLRQANHVLLVVLEAFVALCGWRKGVDGWVTSETAFDITEIVAEAGRDGGDVLSFIALTRPSVPRITHTHPPL